MIRDLNHESPIKNQEWIYHLIQHVEQLALADRFGDVAVEPRFEAALAIAPQRMRGHRDDPLMAPRALLGSPDGGRRFEPPISGIWISISTTSKEWRSRRSNASRPFAAVVTR